MHRCPALSRFARSAPNGPPGGKNSNSAGISNITDTKDDRGLEES